jgi:hypothetical protein
MYLAGSGPRNVTFVTRTGTKPLRFSDAGFPVPYNFKQ